MTSSKIFCATFHENNKLLSVRYLNRSLHVWLLVSQPQEASDTEGHEQGLIEDRVVDEIVDVRNTGVEARDDTLFALHEWDENATQIVI